MADLDELAEKGKAARLAEDRQKAELRARYEGEQTDEHRKAAAWRLSSLALNPLRFAFTIPGWIVWLMSVFMAFPYFQWFLTGKPVHGSSKGGSKWVLDPTKEGYWLFYPFAIFTTIMVAAIVWKVRANRAARRALAAETAWAGSAAIPILNYPMAIGQDEHRFKIDIYFAHRVPEREKLADIMRGVDTYLKDEDRDSKCCRFVADYPRDDNPVRNARRFVATFHTVVEGVLAPMLAEHPIDRIEVRG